MGSRERGHPRVPPRSPQRQHPDTHPDPIVEQPVIRVLIKILLRVHADGVGLQVLLDLSDTGCETLPDHSRGAGGPGAPPVPPLTRCLNSSRSSRVSVSALAITGTTLTILLSLRMNSRSRGRSLGEGGQLSCCHPPAAPVGAGSQPWHSPVPRGGDEVHAAVHPAVRDLPLAGDEDLLAQVPLVLLVDVLDDGVPAGGRGWIRAAPLGFNLSQMPPRWLRPTSSRC